jgi:hypothetical protein
LYGDEGKEKLQCMIYTQASTASEDGRKVGETKGKKDGRTDVWGREIDTGGEGGRKRVTKEREQRASPNRTFPTEEEKEEGKKVGMEGGKLERRVAKRPKERKDERTKGRQPRRNARKKGNKAERQEDGKGPFTCAVSLFSAISRALASPLPG